MLGRKNNKTKDFLQNDDPNFIIFNRNRAQLCDLIRDVYSGVNSNLSSEELYKKYQQMLNYIVNRNPFFDRYERLKVAPVFNLNHSKKFGAETFGIYDRDEDLIVVSSKLLYDTLVSREKPLAQLFYTIGHEMGHESQKKEIDKIDNFENVDKNLSDDQKAKIQKLVDDFYAVEVDEYTIRILTEMLEQRLGKKIENFTGQDEQRKIGMCTNFAYLLYFQAEHERDARKIGYDFANFMIDRLCEVEHLEKYIREDLLTQKAYLSREQSDDNYIENMANPFYKKLDEVFENMTVEEFGKLVHDMEHMLDTGNLNIKGIWIDDDDKKSLIEELRMKVVSAIEYLNFEICRGKSADAVMDYIMDSCVAGCAENIPYLISALKEKKDFTKEKQKQLKINVADLLTDRDLLLGLYEADYRGLFDDKERRAILQYFLKEKKDVQAFAFYRWNVGNVDGQLRVKRKWFKKDFELEPVDLFAEEIIDRYRNFANNCKKLGKISNYEFGYVSNAFAGVFTNKINKKKVEEIEEELIQLLDDEKIVYMTDEEENEYLKAKYEEVLANDMIARKIKEMPDKIKYREELIKKHRKTRGYEQEEGYSSGGLLGEGSEIAQE